MSDREAMGKMVKRLGPIDTIKELALAIREQRPSIEHSFSFLLDAVAAVWECSEDEAMRREDAAKRAARAHALDSVETEHATLNLAIAAWARTGSALNAAKLDKAIFDLVQAARVAGKVEL